VTEQEEFGTATIAGIKVKIPSKCNPTPGAGNPPNPCTEPGTLPRCQLCPSSPTYWLRDRS
jgi:hypothetical protein